MSTARNIVTLPKFGILALVLIAAAFVAMALVYPGPASAHGPGLRVLERFSTITSTTSETLTTYPDCQQRIHHPSHGQPAQHEPHRRR